MNYKVFGFGVVFTLISGLNSLSVTNETHGSEFQPLENETEEYPYYLPFLGQKAIDAGEELPLPMGISMNYYYVKRDIDVKTIQASLNNNPLGSVDDLVAVDVQTRVQTGVVRLDAWIFPFLNVYGLLGHIDNESSIDASVTIGTNRNINIKTDSGFQGTTTGLGTVLAAGYNDFFMTIDANWVFSELGDAFDTTFQGQIYNARIGWKGKIRDHNTRVWLGGAYWDTEREMSGSIPVGANTVNFRVVQGPVNPTTYSLGLNYEFTERWNIVLDVGGNGNDASSFLCAFNYRFH